MKTKSTLLASLIAAGLCMSASAEVRTWTDVQGRQVSATFVKIEGEDIVLQTADGALHKFALTRLSAEDQAIAKAAKPAESSSAEASPTFMANATVAQAAAKVDQLVANGLIRSNPARIKAGKAPIKSFNAPASDEQFVRRVYLDIAGRIPNFDEATAFIKAGGADKRAKLIDQLLAGQCSRHPLHRLA